MSPARSPNLVGQSEERAEVQCALGDIYARRYVGEGVCVCEYVRARKSSSGPCHNVRGTGERDGRAREESPAKFSLKLEGASFA